jgi:hypothetical protein
MDLEVAPYQVLQHLGNVSVDYGVVATQPHVVWNLLPVVCPAE